jgi:hypothetical protein
VNRIRISPTELEVSTLIWEEKGKGFVAGPARCFNR